MIHPTDPDLRDTAAVREGRIGPVTCATCGCRLTAQGDAWFHFNPLGGRDARGCRIDCAEAAHDASGRPHRRPRLTVAGPVARARRCPRYSSTTSR